MQLSYKSLEAPSNLPLILRIVSGSLLGIFAVGACSPFFVRFRLCATVWTARSTCRTACCRMARCPVRLHLTTGAVIAVAFVACVVTMVRKDVK